jgi:hypothetical protein
LNVSANFVQKSIDVSIALGQVNWLLDDPGRVLGLKTSGFSEVSSILDHGFDSDGLSGGSKSKGKSEFHFLISFCIRFYSWLLKQSEIDKKWLILFQKLKS